MLNNQKVSVIIPVYNGEKTLKQCLDSVLNQTFKDYEVIVVDNNSTDRTREIIKEFEKKNKKVRYLFEAKIGIGAARNAGEKKSRGEIILMTDSDCIVPKDWIKKMTEPIIKKNQVAVQGFIKPIFLNYWTKHIGNEKKKSMKGIHEKDKFDWFSTANLAIKKSILKEVGGINPDLVTCDDTELLIRLKLRNYKVYPKNISVFHDYPRTSWRIFKKKFKYGELNSKIKKMYKTKKDFFQNENFFNHLGYFVRIFLEFLTFHKNFRYDSVSGIAWRTGLIYGWIRR